MYRNGKYYKPQSNKAGKYYNKPHPPARRPVFPYTQNIESNNDLLFLIDLANYQETFNRLNIQPFLPFVFDGSPVSPAITVSNDRQGQISAQQRARFHRNFTFICSPWRIFASRHAFYCKRDNLARRIHRGQ